MDSIEALNSVSHSIADEDVNIVTILADVKLVRTLVSDYDYWSRQLRSTDFNRSEEMRVIADFLRDHIE